MTLCSDSGENILVEYDDLARHASHLQDEHQKNQQIIRMLFGKMLEFQKKLTDLDAENDDLKKKIPDAEVVRQNYRRKIGAARSGYEREFNKTQQMLPRARMMQSRIKALKQLIEGSKDPQAEAIPMEKIQQVEKINLRSQDEILQLDTIKNVHALRRAVSCKEPSSAKQIAQHQVSRSHSVTNSSRSSPVLTPRQIQQQNCGDLSMIQENSANQSTLIKTLNNVKNVSQNLKPQSNLPVHDFQGKQLRLFSGKCRNCLRLFTLGRNIAVCKICKIQVHNNCIARTILPCVKK